MLTEREQDDLILAFFDPGDDCSHNMTPAFKVIEAIVAAHVTAALNAAADELGHIYQADSAGVTAAIKFLRNRTNTT